MSTFVVAIFPDETKIGQGVSALKELHAKGSITLYASAIVAKDSGGMLSVRDFSNEGHGGAAVGALIGGLAGLPAGPFAMMFGVAGGAIIGNSADRMNKTSEAAFADKLSSELAPGKTAILAGVDEDRVTSVKATMEASGGTLIRWSGD